MQEETDYSFMCLLYRFPTTNALMSVFPSKSTSCLSYFHTATSNKVLSQWATCDSPVSLISENIFC